MENKKVSMCNAESDDLPDFLRVGKGKYYKIVRPQRVNHRITTQGDRHEDPSRSPDLKTEPNLPKIKGGDNRARSDIMGRMPATRSNLIFASMNMQTVPGPSSSLRDKHQFHVNEQFKTVDSARMSTDQMKVYDCILNQNKIVNHPSLSPERIDKESETFHDFFKEHNHGKKPFNLKAGEFNEFANASSRIITQYKIQKNDQIHNRYASKPFLITQSNSVNKYTNLSASEHTKLLSHINEKILVHDLKKNSSNSNKIDNLTRSTFIQPHTSSSPHRFSLDDQPDRRLKENLNYIAPISHNNFRDDATVE